MRVVIPSLIVEPRRWTDDDVITDDATAAAGMHARTWRRLLAQGPPQWPVIIRHKNKLTSLAGRGVRASGERPQQQCEK